MISGKAGLIKLSRLRAADLRMPDADRPAIQESKKAIILTHDMSCRAVLRDPTNPAIISHGSLPS